MTESFRWQESGNDSPQMLHTGHKVNDPKHKRGRRDYGKHDWTMRESVWEVVKCTGIVGLLCTYFYRSIWAAVPLGILGIMFWKLDERKKVQRDRYDLLLQFGDMIRSVEAAMRAGYSVENAFLESYGDMRLMHGRDSIICKELLLIQRGLEMNVSLEEMLEDLGERSGLAQVKEFVQIMVIARKNGGNMAEVIAYSAQQIYRRTRIREEIMIQTAERRLERNIMDIMPFVILTYIGVSSRGYFEVLYHNLQGMLIMSGCLFVYLTGFWLSERILEKALRIGGQE